MLGTLVCHSRLFNILPQPAFQLITGCCVSAMGDHWSRVAPASDCAVMAPTGDTGKNWPGLDPGSSSPVPWQPSEGHSEDSTGPGGGRALPGSCPESLLSVRPALPVSKY